MRICCIIYLLALIALTSFGQTQNSFVGTWKVDVAESINKMDTKAKARFDSLTENHRAQITKAFKKLEISFNADNTFISNSLTDNKISTQNGTWETEMATSNLMINWGSRVERLRYRFIDLNTVLLITANSDWFKETYLTKN